MLDQIKILREKTGAGMVDCKKALTEADGDMEKAVEILRKKGIAKAAKREERETNEGIILVSADPAKNKAYIIEFNAETDFVVRSEKYSQFTKDVFGVLRSFDPENMDALMSLQMADGHSVRDNLDTLSGVIGEKLGIKNFEILKSSGGVGAYSHAGGRIAAIVGLNKADDDLPYEIAMQVAAANPKYVTREEIPADVLEKEKEIYRAQLSAEGKPEAIAEKIMAGKLNKFYEEVCLVDQEYIKDDNKKVKDILGGVSVEKFVRYAL